MPAAPADAGLCLLVTQNTRTLQGWQQGPALLLGRLKHSGGEAICIIWTPAAAACSHHIVYLLTHRASSDAGAAVSSPERAACRLTLKLTS